MKYNDCHIQTKLGKHTHTKPFALKCIYTGI